MVHDSHHSSPHHTLVQFCDTLFHRRPQAASRTGNLPRSGRQDRRPPHSRPVHLLLQASSERSALQFSKPSNPSASALVTLCASGCARQSLGPPGSRVFQLREEAERRGLLRARAPRVSALRAGAGPLGARLGARDGRVTPCGCGLETRLKEDPPLQEKDKYL